MRKTKQVTTIYGLLAIFVIIIITIAFSQMRWTTKLLDAITTNDEMVVQELLESPFKSVNVKGFSTIGELSVERPLETACWQSNFQIIELLIEHGAKLKGEKVLNNVLEIYDSDDLDIIELLINSGLVYNVKASNENNCLVKIAGREISNKRKEKEAESEHIKYVYIKTIESAEVVSNKEEIYRMSLQAAIKADNKVMIQYLEGQLKKEK